MSNGSYFSHSRPQMRAFVPTEALRVLDIGCGDGAFAAGLRAERREQGRELEIWGLELDSDAARRATANLDEVRCGPAEDLLPDLPRAHFDCVVMNDVLEHIAWPQPLLSGLHAVMAPGARLVTSMPNVRHFPHLWNLVVHGDWRYRDEGILDRTHLRFYTRDTMIELLETTGFRVREQHGINPTRSLRWRLFNLLSLGRARDMQFLQFACVAASAREETT